MKYSYIARQPILDNQQKTIGYELLFRDGPNNTFPDIDPDIATNRLLSEHFLATHYSTIGDKLGFVNFPYQSLVNLVPTLFPKDNLVIEILESCEPTKELLSAVRKMAEAGYTIALDDFIPKKEWLPFLPYTSIIKIDIRQYPLDKAKALINKLHAHDIIFLAEKVETYEEFELAKSVGFTQFQGYFFSKPQLIRRKQIKPSFPTVVQLCKEISNPNINYDELERLFSLDVTLSYKLLTFVNSSYLIRAEIKSFKQALVYLGEDRLRKFISLVAITSTQDDKPDSLYSLSIQRARFCELILQDMNSNIEDGLGFLTGMFSLLDSLFDQPLEELVHKMPINNLVKSALVIKKGKLGDILSLVKAYEAADWSSVIQLRDKLELNDERLAKHYDDAIKWTEDLLTIESDYHTHA
ncbi:histidine kinase [Vibrio sp. 10N.286.49.C2]|uniref:EAL and HDOD domain-containing protein n=1 Tax=unclassified Vibrio TaxID=2614977 RepID=UPI000C83D012|nr:MULTISPECIES: HDOD domain-containing protein [unclassified Vibrio]PMH31637.1 histidine kinase [Vibrio sp. 10N.286.49.C2]PMH50660.1 histidine kinase [Vibrio sp. 10N.286.49.B1]PMH78093.1 histidine kinase [Vibrio sp. 10N.286.48.B7]